MATDQPSQCGHDGCDATDHLAMDVDFAAGEAVPRCPDHFETSTAFWFTPGDHPSLPSAENWPLECDTCGESFAPQEGIWGVRDGRFASRRETMRCLGCAGPSLLERFDETVDDDPHLAVCDECGILGECPSEGGAFNLMTGHWEEVEHATIKNTEVLPAGQAEM